MARRLIRNILKGPTILIPVFLCINVLFLLRFAPGCFHGDVGTDVGTYEPQSGGYEAQDLTITREELDNMLGDMRRVLRMNDDGKMFSDLRGPGEAKLRDVAVKGRVFKDAIGVWEKVNYFTSDGILHPRPGIIARLKKASNNSDAISTYDQFQHFISVLGSRLFPWSNTNSGDLSALHASYRGRGIVLTGGNPQVKHLRTLIQSIRKLGCTLPIELMYMGDKDLSEKYRKDFVQFPDVIVRDLSLMVNHTAWEFRGWAIKPYAMLASSFREVLFIDADTLFLVNPETLFASKEFTSSGTLFYKDRTLFPRDTKPFIEAILPEVSEDFKKENRYWTGSSSHMMESGVVLMDKHKHFVPLLMAARLNGPDRDGQGEGDTRIKGLYDYIQGDKETFWLGFEMIGSRDYKFHPMPMGSLGRLKKVDEPVKSADGRDEHIICSAQILHFDDAGKPTWLNGGLKTTKVRGDAPWAEFEVYLREPDDPGTSGLSRLWDIEPANIMCLRNHEYSKFTDKEREVFKMLIELGKEDEDFVTEREKENKG